MIQNWDGTASPMPSFQRDDPGTNDSDYEEERFNAGMKRMITRAELHRNNSK